MTEPNNAEEYVTTNGEDGLMEWLDSVLVNDQTNDLSLNEDEENAFLTDFLMEAGADQSTVLDWVTSLNPTLEQPSTSQKTDDGVISSRTDTEVEDMQPSTSQKTDDGKTLSRTDTETEVEDMMRTDKKKKLYTSWDTSHTKKRNITFDQQQSTSAESNTVQIPNDSTIGSRYQQMRINVDGSLRQPTDQENQLEIQGGYTIKQNKPKSYLLKERNRRSFAKRTAEEVIYDVKLENDLNGEMLVNIIPDLKSTFNDVLKEIRPASAKDTDLVRVYVQHPDLRVPITVSPRPWADMDVRTIMDKIEYVLTSKESLKVEEGFTIHVGSISVPNGGGRSKIVHVTGHKSCLVRKKSVVSILNKDNLCLARSIVVGLASLNEDPNYDNIRKQASGLQRVRAEELHKKLGLSFDIRCSLNEIHLFEEAVGVQIVVFSATRVHKPLYVGKQKDKRLYLYHTEDDQGQGHYDTIISITGCIGVAYFCHRCLIGYDHRKDHMCEAVCGVCRRQDCDKDQGDPMKCFDCNRLCKSSSCYDQHRKAYKDASNNDHKSECSKYIMCPECHLLLERKSRNLCDHICGEWQCRYCQGYFTQNHLCYMRTKLTKATPLKHLYFDFECEQSSTIHHPNFVIAQTACDLCQDEDLTEESKCSECGNRCEVCDKFDRKEKEYVLPPCEATCGFREVKFSGENTQNDFCEFLFSKTHQDFTVLAHNSRGYDAYFLLEFLIHTNTRRQIIPSIIYSGSKIMSMTVKPFNIKVIDSLNFLPMPLAKFPKAFGLTELRKGWFPHRFNLPENFTYRGPFPEASYYGHDFMSPENRKAFLVWHEEQVRQNEVFDFQQQIEDYCKSDVDILRRACLKFRSLLMSVTSLDEGDIGIDPFDNMTIASTCMSIFQSKFMKENWMVLTESEQHRAESEKSEPLWEKATFRNEQFSIPNVIDKTFVDSPIGIVPPRGYQSDTHSKVSIQWLLWEEEKCKREGNPIHIQHALNEGEKSILGPDKKHYYKADGFCQATNTIYEFYGDVVHGCPKCFPHDEYKTALHPYTGRSMKQLYERTIEREGYLKQQGYKIKAVWEHEFHDMLKDDQDMKTFVETLDIQSRLDPRDAFFGGRTNGIKLYYKTTPDEKIHYVDFTSLYPFINKFGIYPVGHPEIITHDFKDINDYFGLAKINILPPQDLYHPVLPCKVNTKLMFPLCRTCAETLSKKTCQCSVDQRCLTGTWSTLEIQKALEKGYELLKIHEVYHFDKSTQYKNGNGGMFTDYVNLFLKLKQQASGWPDWVKTDQDKNTYIDNYFKHEGIQLNKEDIEGNPALRSLAKLCLNSLWGKLGQRQNMAKSTIVNDGAEFLRLLFDQSVNVTDFHILSEHYAQIDWKNKDEFAHSDARTNIFLALFTTAQARLKLYEVIEQLDKRVLYFDTDSVVYVSREGDWEPSLGDYLGELTSELGCKEVQCPGCEEDHYITEFITCGPKNYGYKVDNGYTQIKIRGFTLHYANGQLINFESMRNILLNDSKKKIKTTNPHKITRNKLEHKIVNRVEDKYYGLVYDKRIVLDNFDTVPYGYSLVN